MTNPAELIESFEGEGAVLGSMILDNTCIAVVADMLEPETFRRPEHREMFDAILALSKHTDQRIDIVMLRDELKKRGKLQEIGGVQYIVEVVDTVPTAANVVFYAEMVQDAYTVRKLLDYAIQVREIACEHLTAPEKLTKCNTRIRAITAGHTRAETVNVATDIGEVCDFKNDTTYISTGFPELDEMTFGLGQSDLIVIAGRPSMGKTALAISLAMNIAPHDGVLIFSLEMSARQLEQRMVIAETKNRSINLKGARKGFLTNQQEGELAEAAMRISHWKMQIEPTPGLTLAGLEARTHRIIMEHDIGVIFVDYLQLMRYTERDKYTGMTNIVTGLKNLARKINRPVVVISQLSRAPEKRDDKRPRMSDLRDSGAIEEAADVIWLLYRPDYYTKEHTGQAEVITAKQRNGETGITALTFVEQWAAFVSPPPAEKRLYD